MVKMKAEGWFRTYGKKSNSSIRTYTYLGADPDNPIYNAKSWTINSIGLFGHRTGGGGNDQSFYKGTPQYDAKILVLKQEGTID
jgi:hypothetical protein